MVQVRTHAAPEASGRLILRPVVGLGLPGPSDGSWFSDVLLLFPGILVEVFVGEGDSDYHQ